MINGCRFKLAQTAKATDGTLGIIAFTPTRWVVPILAGVAAKVNGKDILFGTTSNWVDKPKIVSVSADAFKYFLVVKEAS